MADADDATRRLEDLDLIAREHGVVPAFRWPDDGDEVEACFVRFHRGEASDGGLAVLEIGAVDGSWREDYLVRADHLEAAVAEPGRHWREPGARGQHA